MNLGSILVFSGVVYLRTVAAYLTVNNISCPVPSEWIQQSDVICYKGSSSQYARFTIKGGQHLYAIRLQHISGGISCRDGRRESRWGCSHHGKKSLLVVITDSSNKIKFLDNYSPDSGQHQIHGYTREDDVLVFKTTTPEYLEGETMYKVWQSHDLFDFFEINKHGQHCVIVDASFIVEGENC